MPAKSAQTWTPVEDEFTIDDIGARLLANLARGIYNHEAVLREYVQNACDAFSALPVFPQHAAIKIDVENEDAISIHDDGSGMDLDGVKAYKKIAVSPKADIDGMTGFRGIGIWAGFQACKHLEMLTTKDGVAERYRLQIDFADILEHVNENINIKKLLDGRFRIHREPAGLAEHYTHVRLIGLQHDYRPLADVTELTRVVSQILPCKIDPAFEYAQAVSEILNAVNGYQEFSILVGDNEVFKPFPVALAEPQSFVLKDNGEEYGRGWFCSGTSSISPKGHQYRGFRLRINNFAVGPVGIYSDENGASFGLFVDSMLKSNQHLNWHVGEIHVTHPEIKPDTPRSALELDSVARRAVQSIRGFYKDRINDSRALADFNKFRTALDACERACNSGESPSTAQLELWNENFASQDQLARGRSTDGLKTRLKNLLAARDTKLRRQRLANWVKERLQAANEASGIPTTPTNNAQAAYSNPSPGSQKAAQQPQQTSDQGGGSIGAAAAASPVSATAPEFDPDVLLSDVFAVIEMKLGADDGNFEPICKAIEDVFREAGLID